MDTHVIYKPMISVIIATKNGSRFISKAVESVQKQTFTDIEIIVVSDGSTDNTAMSVRQLAEKDARIRLIENTVNKGPGLSRDQGIQESRGNYIAFIDDDDIWLSTEKLAVQKKYLDEHPTIDVVGASHIEFVKENQRDENANTAYATTHLFTRMQETDPEKIWKNMLSYNPIVNSSVLFRKSAYTQAGGFKPMYLAEDYDLWLRMGKLKKIANVDKADIQYLVRTGGVTVGNKTISRNTEMAKVVLRLVNEYKNSYPGFTIAIIKGYLRLIIILFKNIF